MADLDRIEERWQIAKAWADVKARQGSVNDLPIVKEARERQSAAHAAYQETVRDFHRVFDAHYPDDEEVVRKLTATFADLFLDSNGHPQFCTATGLAIFKGDRIIGEKDDPSDPDNENYRSAILADGVTLRVTRCDLLEGSS